MAKYHIVFEKYQCYNSIKIKMTHEGKMIQSLYQVPEYNQEKINLAKQIGFTNINIDLIYALPKQSIEDLKEAFKKFMVYGILFVNIFFLSSKCCIMVIH